MHNVGIHIFIFAVNQKRGFLLGVSHGLVNFATRRRINHADNAPPSGKIFTRRQGGFPVTVRSQCRGGIESSVFSKS